MAAATVSSPKTSPQRLNALLELTITLARSYLAQNKLKELVAEFKGTDMPPAEQAQVLIARGLAQIGLKDIPAATKSLQEAQQLAPDNVDSTIALARLAALNNDSTAALEQLDHALTVKPDSVDALLFRGEVQRILGKSDDAIASFDKAVAVSPTNNAVRLQRVGALLGQGKNEAAAADLAVVLKAEPKNPIALYFSAVIDIRNAKWQEANAKLSQITPALPRLQRGEYFLALVKANVNQLEQAAEAAERYVNRNKSDPSGYKLLARIDGMAGRTNDLVEVLKRGVAAGVGDSEMLEMLGTAYNQTGQLNLGLNTLQKAAQMAPENPEILSRIATTKLGLGDSEGAQADLDKSLQMNPDRVEAGEALIVAALASGDVKKAASTLDMLSKSDKVAPQVLGNLTGLVRLAQLDLVGAADSWKKVIALNHDALPPRLNLARVLSMQGQNAEALEVIMPVLEIQPANLPALSAATTMLVAMNRLPDAIRLVEAARRAQPTNLELVAAQAELEGRAGNLAGALAMVDASVTAADKVPQRLLAERARIQLAMKRPNDAMETLSTMLATDPQDVDSRRELVSLLVADKQYEAAKREARAGIAAVPGSIPLMQAFVQASYSQQGIDAGLAAADLLLRDPTNLPGARTLKGGLYSSVGRFKDAAASFQQQLAVAPSSILASYAAAAMASDKRPQDGIALLKEYIRTAPESEALQELASLQITIGQFDDAEASLQAVLKQRPNDAQALNNLAWVYVQKGDNRAQITAQKAYMLAPGPQAADTLGWVLVKTGSTKTGLLLIKQAADQLPLDQQIQYHLAVALHESGDSVAALKVLDSLLARTADFEEKPAAAQLQAELRSKSAGK